MGQKLSKAAMVSEADGFSADSRAGASVTAGPFSAGTYFNKSFRRGFPKRVEGCGPLLGRARLEGNHQAGYH